MTYRDWLLTLLDALASDPACCELAYAVRQELRDTCSWENVSAAELAQGSRHSLIGGECQAGPVYSGAISEPERRRAEAKHQSIVERMLHDGYHSDALEAWLGPECEPLEGA